MQALHLLALEPVAETTVDKNAYGFRLERSTAGAIQQCFCALAKKQAPEWALEADIKSCFDEIDHAWMEANTPMYTAVQATLAERGLTLSAEKTKITDIREGFDFPGFMVTQKRLLKMTDLPIKRQVKIKAAATPYDSAYHDYFEQRAQARKRQAGWPDPFNLWSLEGLSRVRGNSHARFVSLFVSRVRSAGFKPLGGTFR